MNNELADAGFGIDADPEAIYDIAELWTGHVLFSDDDDELRDVVNQLMFSIGLRVHNALGGKELELDTPENHLAEDMENRIPTGVTTGRINNIADMQTVAQSYGVKFPTAN